MLGFNFGIDELPADPGDRCYYCREFIIGTKYIPYLTTSLEHGANYYNQMCKFCYTDKFVDKPPTQEEIEFTKRVVQAKEEIQNLLCKVHNKSAWIYAPEPEKVRFGIATCCDEFKKIVMDYYFSLLK